uniref:Uncharacterized protein n=1 Tax=Myoviridae sp. ctCo31 TaxID=2825053 RepID=A0A8S5UMK5_9CAUD|nr:MAG TPA: hypothetical protein [Myoviridae sp. ctCo31]
MIQNIITTIKLFRLNTTIKNLIRYLKQNKIK